jgi:glutamate/tyrosine decarboxylase-like PLP-dependent enzyme
MFGTTASYLKDTQSTVMEEKNFYDRGLQLTRSFKAFKFYLSIKTFGLETFQRAIDKGIDMAMEVERILRSRPNWRIITAAQMGIITFQYAPGGLSEEEISACCLKISQELTREGYAMVLTTTLFNKTVLRMCPIHPNVTIEELEEVIRRMEVGAKK